jgi:hypothetical protein
MQRLNSRIEVNEETGRKSLLVYYDGKEDDYERQIEVAMAFYGVSEGEMVIIAMPKTWQTDGDRL